MLVLKPLVVTKIVQLEQKTPAGKAQKIKAAVVQISESQQQEWSIFLMLWVVGTVTFTVK